MKITETYQNLLKHELCSRSLVNPKYSLRSFAKSLSLSASYLSLIFSKKRQMSMAMGLKILHQFDWSQDLKEQFLRDIYNQNLKKGENFSQSAFNTAKSLATSTSSEENTLDVSIENFSVISHWYFPVLVEIVGIFGEKKDVAAIARCIGLPPATVRASLTVLTNLELIVKTQKGFKRCAANRIDVKPTPSEHIRNYHREVLDQAYQSVAAHSPAQREMTALVIPVHSRKIALARTLIHRFREEMALLVSSSDGSEVYQLAVQFYPATIKPSATIA